jgi:hypothetical protein
METSALQASYGHQIKKGCQNQSKIKAVLAMQPTGAIIQTLSHLHGVKDDLE